MPTLPLALSALDLVVLLALAAGAHHLALRSIGPLITSAGGAVQATVLLGMASIAGVALEPGSAIALIGVGAVAFGLLALAMQDARPAVVGAGAALVALALAAAVGWLGGWPMVSWPMALAAAGSVASMLLTAFGPRAPKRWPVLRRMGRVPVAVAAALLWIVPVAALLAPQAWPWPFLLAGPYAEVFAFALLSLVIAGAAGAIARRQGRVHRRLAINLGKVQARAGGPALIDALTGVASPVGFDAWLAPALAESASGRIALFALGLDGFKRVNDAFGRSGGDAALKEVARRLEAACEALSTPPSLVLGPVVRLGGDEFGVAMQGRAPQAEQARVAAALLERVTQRIAIDGGETQLEASIGIATASAAAQGPTLVPHAQAALRAAKESGGSTYVFFETRLIDEARDRLDLLRDLRRAVESNQLELYYQPKVDAKTCQVTAAEALLRWQHPTRGLVSPMVFVPLAERFGLIDSIGRWVIEDACRQAAAWRKAGLKMRVAINVSAQQMRQGDIVAQIEGALKRHGIDPTRFTCEITESVAMEDTQATQRTFEQLGAAGIHVSIDDFGTGYSSLAYLRRLPAQELKVDRAFVKDLGVSDDARKIVDAIVKLAHAIGLKVVAEGVENETQRDALMRLGCDELQGYMFAKPMTARALLIWALDDRPVRAAFRESLFASTATPTVIRS